MARSRKNRKAAKIIGDFVRARDACRIPERAPSVWPEKAIVKMPVRKVAAKREQQPHRMVPVALHPLPPLPPNVPRDSAPQKPSQMRKVSAPRIPAQVRRVSAPRKPAQMRKIPLATGATRRAQSHEIDENSKILVLGDGNFSFSVAMCRRIGTPELMVATSYDSYETLKSKYGDSFHNIYSNLTELTSFGVRTEHGVDARELDPEKLIHSGIGATFDTVIFNFPHGGLDDNEGEGGAAKQKHRSLLSSLFETVGSVLVDEGRVYITLTGSGQFNDWQVERSAKNAGFILVRNEPFCHAKYPHYKSAWGDARDYSYKKQPRAGFKSGRETSMTYVFARK